MAPRARRTAALRRTNAQRLPLRLAAHLLALLALRLLLVLLLLLRGLKRLLLLGRLDVKRLGREGLELGQRVCHDDVVEKRARLDLPQLEADGAAWLAHVVDLAVLLVLGVGHVLLDPGALVRGVGDALRLPRALVGGVVDLGHLPLAVLLVVPVLGLLRVGVGDLGGDVVPAGGLDVCGVVHLRVVDPVGGLDVRGVLDRLRGQDVEVRGVREGAGLDLLAVDERLVRLVRVQRERVAVRDALLRVDADVLLDEVVLVLVRHDDVRLARRRAADVRAEHDAVGGVAAELLGVEARGEQLREGAAGVVRRWTKVLSASQTLLDCVVTSQHLQRCVELAAVTRAAGAP